MPVDTYPPQNITAQTPLLAYSPLATSINGVGATEVDGPSITITVPAGRTIRLTASAQINNDGNTGHMIGRFREVTAANAELGRWAVYDLPASATGTVHTDSFILNPSAGTHTYKLTLQKNTGSGSVNWEGLDVAIPSYIMAEDITGSQLPVLPQSVPVGILAQTYNFGSGFTFTSLVAIPGASVTVTVPAGRLLKITGKAHLISSAATDRLDLFLLQDGVTLDGAFKNSVVATQGQDTIVTFTTSPSAGSHTYSLSVQRDGSGTGSIFSTPGTSQTFLIVEDITATPAPASGSPSSLLAQAQVTTSQSGITTVTDLTGLNVTVTVPAGRVLKITGKVAVNGTVASSTAAMQIQEGSTVLQNIQIQNSTTAGNGTTQEGSAIVTPSAGTHTYKLTLQLSAGTGTVGMAAAASFPAFITVEDITGTSISTPAGASPAAITLGYASSTATQSGISTETDVTGCLVTITVPDGRRVRVSGRAEVGTPSVNNNVFLLIREVTAANVEVGRAAEVLNTSTETTLLAESVLTPSAGVHTYKLTLQSNTGTFNTTNIGTSPNYIVVEDITGQPWPTASTSVPVGLLGQAQLTANSAAAAGLNNILSVAATVPSGRTLRVRFETYIQNNTVNALAGARAAIYMDSAATGIGGSGQIQQSDLRLTAANVPEKFTCHAVVSPAAGSHTFSVNLDNGGGGTITMVAGAGYPTILTVEDITPTPAAASTAPSALLAQAQVTTGQTIGATSTETDVTGLAVTFTVAAGRVLKVTGHSGFQAGVAGDRIVGYIKEGATYLGRYGQEDAQQNGGYMIFDGCTVVSPAAGTHTYKLTAQRYGGTGSLATDNSTDRPGAIYVEDITPASVAPVVTPNGVTPTNSTARPSSPWVGMMIYETDTGNVMVWNGSFWVPVSAAAETVAFIATTATGGSTTSTSFVNYGAATISRSITKYQTATGWEVHGDVGAYVTTAGSTVDIGLNVGGTDYWMERFFYNAAGTHATISINGGIGTGLAPGTYTVTLRWRSPGGSTINVDNNDFVHISFREAFIV